MAIRFQLRRGNTAENDAFTGAVGELTLDTQRKVIRFHDGVTKGGIPLGAPSLVAFQRPTADNNYTWFRKYSDGWVEQGGIKLQGTTNKQDLSLPIEMSGQTYSVLTSVMDDNLSNFVFCVKVTDKTTTGFKTTVWGSYQQGMSANGYNFVWQVSGISAQ